MQISQIMSLSYNLTDLCAIKQTFVYIVYNVLEVEKFLQTVKFKSSSIKFKIYRKQLAVPFKIYADFEYNVKKVKSSDKSSDKGNNSSYTEKCQSHIRCRFSYKLV